MTLNELLDAIQAWLQTGWSLISVGAFGELTIGMALFSLLLALISLPFLYILTLEILNDIHAVLSRHSHLELFAVGISYLTMSVSALVVALGVSELFFQDGQELMGASLIIAGSLFFWLGHILLNRFKLKARHSSDKQ